MDSQVSAPALLVAEELAPRATPSSSKGSDFRGSRGSAHLDAVRGIAAILVFIGHLRFLFFKSYADADYQRIYVKLLYVVTGFGGESVLVFFVLSGFLISGSIFRSLKRGNWSWGSYLAHRCTRLYVVLLPGLLLTLFWDQAGHALFPDLVLDPSEPPSIFRAGAEAIRQSSGWLVFLGNVAFLQTIAVPTFGSNFSLWSLSNEFWYYLLLPTIWIALFGTCSRMQKALCLGVFLALSYWLRHSVLVEFVYFLLGVLLTLLHERHLFRSLGRSDVTCVLGLMFAVSVVASRFLFHGSAQTAASCLTLFLLIVFLYALILDDRPASRIYTAIAGTLSSFSFTLYVLHVPILVFLRRWLISGQRWDPSPPYLLRAFGIMLGVLIYAYVVSRLTEAHTDSVRRFLFGGSRPKRVSLKSQSAG